MKFKFHTNPTVTVFILNLKVRLSNYSVPAVFSCDKKRLVTYCSDLIDGDGFKYDSELKDFLSQNRVIEEKSLSIDQYFNLSKILICLDNDSDKKRIRNINDTTKVKINNLSDYCYDYKYVVARFVEGDWWYFGSYNETDRAYEVALSENGMVFRTDDIVEGDY